jgi:hypothetical protein
MLLISEFGFTLYFEWQKANTPKYIQNGDNNGSRKRLDRSRNRQEMNTAKSSSIGGERCG